MPRNTLHSGWKKKDGKWTCSLGSRGMRVRLFQNRRAGPFYRAVWIPGVGRDVASLRTNNRHDAEDFGRKLLAEMLAGGPESVREDQVFLGDLWERYSRAAPSFLDSADSTKQDARSRARVLLAHFGKDCRVSKLTANDVAAYTRTRLAGGIDCGNGRVTPNVRARSAEADLALLQSMLLWAMTVWCSNGRKWLAENPLLGVRRGSLWREDPAGLFEGPRRRLVGLQPQVPTGQSGLIRRFRRRSIPTRGRLST